METNANHILIGFFVLAMTAAGFAFLYWLTDFGGHDGKTYEILFEGDVSGLTRSSPVLFNGLKIGTVRSVALYPKDSRKVQVLIDVTPKAPVRINSRARLQTKTLTGLAMIKISPGTPDAALLRPAAGRAFARIKAERGTDISLGEALPELLGNANALITRLNDLVANNEDTVRKAVSNLEATTEQLRAVIAGNSAGIQQIVENLKSVSAGLRANQDNINGIIADVRKTAATLADNRDNFNAIMADARSMVGTFKANQDNFNAIIADARSVIGNFRKNEDNFNTIMANARSFTDSMAAARSDITAIITDARGVAKQARAITAKIDHTVDQVSKYVAGDGEGLVKEARDAIASFTQLGQKLNASLGKDSGEVMRLAKRNLQELEPMLEQAKRAFASMERLLDSLEKKPNSVIFGRQTQPIYKPGQ